jgi:hypothetical protein
LPRPGNSAGSSEPEETPCANRLTASEADDAASPANAEMQIVVCGGWNGSFDSDIHLVQPGGTNMTLSDIRETNHIRHMVRKPT